MDGSLYLVLFGDVGRCRDSAFRVLLAEFIQHVCSSPNDTDTVSVNGIFLKQGFANARCGSNDDDVHRIVLIRPPWAERSALCPQLTLCSLMHAQKKQRFCQDGVP